MPSVATVEPPRARPVQYSAPMGTRWEKEKAAAGNGAFDYPEDPDFIGPWVLGECVGKGATGRVRIAKHRRTHELAAVKILPLHPHLSSRASFATQQAKSEKFRLGVDREIITMKLMNHPNIMRIYDVYEGEKELYLVLEYIEGGELFDFLVNRGKMAPLDALAYFKQIAYGLNYAHTFSIIHRDLKPENILIQSLNPPLIKIADWGMAAYAPPASHLETSCGSPHYASPEIVNGEKYKGTASDIWSCGVILYALLTGRLPFDDKNVRHLLTKVKLGKYELYPWIDPQARDLLSRMLVVDVAQRITMPEILAHPWLRNKTPGIRCVPAPPVAELARPFPSSAHIDCDILESLHVICGRHASIDYIKADLLSPAGEGTLAKAFYFLLRAHRDSTLQQKGIEMDVDDSAHAGKIILKQYVRPLSQAIVLSAHAERDLPQMKAAPTGPLPPAPPTTMPPRMVRMSRHLSADSAISYTTRPRAPSPVGPRDPRPRPKSVVASPASPRKDLRTIRSTVASPRKGSAIPAPAVTRPRAPVRSQTSPAHTMAEPAANPRLSVPAVSLADSPPISFDSLMERLQTHGTSPTKRTSVYPSRNIDAARGTQPVPIQVPKPVRPGAPGSIKLFAAPKVADDEFQRSMDYISDKLNGLIDFSNEGRPAVPDRRLSRDYDMQRPSLDNAQRVFRRADTAPMAAPPASSGEKRTRDKENWAGHGERGGAKFIPFGKRAHQEGESFGAAAHGLGFGKANAVLGVDPFGVEPLKKKSRPPALELQSDTPKRPLHFSGVSPLPLSPTLTSPAGEFKGWFSNLFSWKQSHVLYSFDTIPRTRDETVRLLECFGVGIVGEDIGGRLVLRCCVEDTQDPFTGSLAQKGVRFKIELSAVQGSGASFHPLSPSTTTHSGGSALSRKTTRNPHGAAGFECMIVLVQEKGSVSTFRSVYQRLREEWRLDALHTPTTFNTGPTPVTGYTTATLVRE